MIQPIERAHRDQLLGMGGYFFLSSPYTLWPNGPEDAFKHACKAAGALMERGARVYSPIAHSHPIAREADLDPYNHAFWMRQCRAMLRSAHGLVLYKMPGFMNSEGMRQERAYAEQNNMPIWTMEFLG